MTFTRTRLVAALVGLALVVAAAVGAAAVSVGNEDVSDEERAGETITATVTLENLYQDPVDEQWYVVGETELRNATWTLTYRTQTGEVLREVDVDGRFVNRSVLDDPDRLLVDANRADSAASVRVRVTGDVPDVEEYTYPELGDEGDAESFVAMRLARDSGTGAAAQPIETWETVHYTEQSRTARTALDNASAAIGEARAAGAEVPGAVGDFENARSAYVNGNFDNAIDLATDAEATAEAAIDDQESQESDGGGGSTLLVAVVVILVLVLAAVGVYAYRGDDDADTKLR